MRVEDLSRREFLSVVGEAGKAAGAMYLGNSLIPLGGLPLNSESQEADPASITVFKVPDRLSYDYQLRQANLKLTIGEDLFIQPDQLLTPVELFTQGYTKEAGKNWRGETTYKYSPFIPIKGVIQQAEPGAEREVSDKPTDFMVLAKPDRSWTYEILPLPRVLSRVLSVDRASGNSRYNSERDTVEWAGNDGVVIATFNRSVNIDNKSKLPFPSITPITKKGQTGVVQVAFEGATGGETETVFDKVITEQTADGGVGFTVSTPNGTRMLHIPAKEAGLILGKDGAIQLAVNERPEAGGPPPSNYLLTKRLGDQITTVATWNAKDGEFGVVGKVTAELGSNVRTTPEVVDSNLAGVLLAKDTPIIITDVVQKGKDSWYQIQYEGKTLYVANSYGGLTYSESAFTDLLPKSPPLTPGVEEGTEAGVVEADLQQVVNLFGQIEGYAPDISNSRFLGERIWSFELKSETDGQNYDVILAQGENGSFSYILPKNFGTQLEKTFFLTSAEVSLLDNLQVSDLQIREKSMRELADLLPALTGTLIEYPGVNYDGLVAGTANPQLKNRYNVVFGGQLLQSPSVTAQTLTNYLEAGKTTYSYGHIADNSNNTLVISTGNYADDIIANQIGEGTGRKPNDPTYNSLRDKGLIVPVDQLVGLASQHSLWNSFLGILNQTGYNNQVPREKQLYGPENPYLKNIELGIQIADLLGLRTLLDPDKTAAYRLFAKPIIIKALAGGTPTKEELADLFKLYPDHASSPVIAFNQ